MKKIYAAVLLIIVMCILAGCGDDDKYVSMVKNGSMELAPNIKIGRAFDKFFGNPKWKSFKATDGRRIVEFNGECTWNGKDAKCCIQFIITGTEHFELGAVQINDVNMNRLDATGILYTALSGE